jgi:hypothetical protein
VFKSKIERFRNKTHYDSPGPGAYNIEKRSKQKVKDYVHP